MISNLVRFKIIKLGTHSAESEGNSRIWRNCDYGEKLDVDGSLTNYVSIKSHGVSRTNALSHGSKTIAATDHKISHMAVVYMIH